MAKKQTIGQKIKKQLDKLENLHAKEEAIVEKITNIIDEEEGNDDNWMDNTSYGGTNGD